MEFTITGKVIGGSRTGRKLGFPTANLHIGDVSGIADGVYKARVDIGGRLYEGIANVGHKPTVGSPQRLLEVHIFGLSADIYGREITVTLGEFIRPERKFDSLEALREQIRKDIEAINKSST